MSEFLLEVFLGHNPCKIIKPASLLYILQIGEYKTVLVKILWFSENLSLIPAGISYKIMIFDISRVK